MQARHKVGSIAQSRRRMRRYPQGSVQQVLISPTFYEQLLHQYSFAKIIQRQTLCREKLLKTLLNKKSVRKILMKLTPGVNFTNISRAAFLYKSVTRKFSVLTQFVLEFFCRKKIGKTAAC